MKRIITTVGTSIFTNYDKENNSNIENIFKNLPFKSWKNYLERIDNIRKTVSKWVKDNPNNPMVSAEIYSINKILEELKVKENEYEVYLIATDTVSSCLAAEIIEEKLSNENINVIFNRDIHYIKGLQVKDREEFEKEGLVNLILKINEILGIYGFTGLDGGESAIINFTGGYKALIPYLTIYAQMNNLPLYYLFNDDEYQLLKIPQAPVSINWGMFEKYYHELLHLKNGEYDWENYKRKNQIEEDFNVCIWEEEGMASLNFIGELFLQEYDKWNICHVLKGSLKNMKKIDKKSLRDAIMGLYGKLNEFVKDNDLNCCTKEEVMRKMELGGDNLNHVSSKTKGLECFICKYPFSKTEVRLLYNFDFKNGQIIKLNIFDFRIGNFKDHLHSKYIDHFVEFYKNNKDGEFVPFLQCKNIEAEVI